MTPGCTDHRMDVRAREMSEFADGLHHLKQFRRGLATRQFRREVNSNQLSLLFDQHSFIGCGREKGEVSLSKISTPPPHHPPGGISRYAVRDKWSIDRDLSGRPLNLSCCRSSMYKVSLLCIDAGRKGESCSCHIARGWAASVTDKPTPPPPHPHQPRGWE